MKSFVPLFLVFVICLGGFVRAEDDEEGKDADFKEDKPLSCIFCYVCFIYRNNDILSFIPILDELCATFKPSEDEVTHRLDRDWRELYNTYTYFRNSDAMSKSRRMPRFCPYVPVFTP